MNVEVSLIIPMNMLPMFGIAIFVAWGRVDLDEDAERVHPEREPGFPLSLRDRLERGAVDLRDERAVEQDERDHAGLEDAEVDSEHERDAEVDPDHADEGRDAAEDVDVDRGEPGERRSCSSAPARAGGRRSRRSPARPRPPRSRPGARGAALPCAPRSGSSRSTRRASQHRLDELLRARVRAGVEEAVARRTRRSGPRSMNTLKSPISRAKLSSCVTTTIVIPDSANSRMTASTSPTSSGSSAEVGSSKSMTFGSRLSARAIATRCCCPPESSAGKWPA